MEEYFNGTNLYNTNNVINFDGYNNISNSALQQLLSDNNNINGKPGTNYGNQQELTNDEINNIFNNNNFESNNNNISFENFGNEGFVNNSSLPNEFFRSTNLDQNKNNNVFISSQNEAVIDYNNNNDYNSIYHDPS